jgi:DNA-binding NarL/FixJ family response regulator
MLRAGLRALLASDDIQVVGDAPSLTELSMELPDADVLVTTAGTLMEDSVYMTLGRSAPSLPGILALSEDSRPATLLRQLALRGWGIISPDAPAAEMQAAVLSVAQGLVVLSLPLASTLVGPRNTVQTLEGGTRPEPLTARETEVLELLSQGLSNKLIARRLNISEHTVKFHVSSIYTKLDASSRTDAVSKGARLGLITL